MTPTAEQIATAVRNTEPETLLTPFTLETDRQNQLLFFLKPECFLLPEPGQARLLDLVLNTLRRFGVEIRGALKLTGPSLGNRGAMDRHYGFINKLSRSASTLVTAADREAITSALGLPQETFILGGHEVLRMAPQLTAKTLDQLWATKKSRKLRSGFYFESYLMDGREVAIVNGFHPYQLEHYTAPGRSIVIMLLHSDLPWKVLRGSMIGDTFPERARPGSIRRSAFESASSLGFEGGVGIANNCCHLSAGPFEAAVEINNFLGRSSGGNVDLTSTNLARQLASRSAGIPLETLLTNPLHPKLNQSLFDATEDVDTFSAVALVSRDFTEHP